MTPPRAPRLDLRPFALADVDAAAAGDAALARHLGAPVADGWMEFPEAFAYWRDRLAADPGLAAWGLYGFFLRDEGGVLVGGGGFKGRPDADGVVEIGYGIAPAFRRRGLAREGAAALVALAFAHPEVRAVRAHTLPTPNASNRLLTGLGFAFEGIAIEDPDDGPVWRWSLARPAGPPVPPPAARPHR